MSKPYDVGGVLYPRPFRIRRLGHFGFNLNRLDEGLAFYGGLLGFQLTDETSLGKLTSGAAPAMEDDRLFFMTHNTCLLYTSPSPRDRTRSRMPSSA